LISLISGVDLGAAVTDLVTVQDSGRDTSSQLTEVGTTTLALLKSVRKRVVEPQSYRGKTETNQFLKR